MAHTDQLDRPGKYYLTIQEMSLRSGLSVSTLHRYVDAGKITAFQPGGPGSRLLFPPNALEQAAFLPRSTGDRSVPKSRPLPGRQPNWMSPPT